MGPVVVAAGRWVGDVQYAEAILVAALVGQDVGWWWLSVTWHHGGERSLVWRLCRQYSDHFGMATTSRRWRLGRRLGVARSTTDS
jgi:hypothetical protein